MDIQGIARKIRAGLWLNYDEIIYLLDQFEHLDKIAQDSIQRLVDKDRLIATLQARLSAKDEEHEADQDEIHRLENRIDSMWGIWGDAGKGRRVYLG
jgi:hypothetical protein